jgi:hypothetical protein
MNGYVAKARTAVAGAFCTLICDFYLPKSGPATTAKISASLRCSVRLFHTSSKRIYAVILLILAGFDHRLGVWIARGSCDGASHLAEDPGPLCSWRVS